MAFNPLNTFQKNKRFWMAAILMVCMISFVFCTGIRGGMEEFLPRYFRSSGPTVVSIDGHSYSDKDIEDLRTQRNLANSFMKNCADMLVKKISKMKFDDSRRQGEDKDPQARAKKLALMEDMIATVELRKRKPRYFDSGVTFDELVEFKLWQAEADRLGINLEKETVDKLFGDEFYWLLNAVEQSSAQQLARNNLSLREASDGMFRRAVAEEFRVKIAQYAVLGSQPYSYFFRKKKDANDRSADFKFADPGVPDETRAPMTVAQLWDAFKAKRANFTVSLIPVPAKDFLALVPEPDEATKRKFFDTYKTKPFDPSSEDSGPEIPTQIKIEYVYADPLSPAYHDLAKKIVKLKSTNKIVFDHNLPPLVAAKKAIETAEREDIGNWFDAEVIRVERDIELEKGTAQESIGDWFDRQARIVDLDMQLEDVLNRKNVIAENYQKDLQNTYDGLVNTNRLNRSIADWRVDRYRGAALFSEADCRTPIAAFLASRHPDLVSELICASVMDPIGALANFAAQGEQRHPAEMEAAVRAEVKRRAPVYGTLIGCSLSLNPLDALGPMVAMDPWVVYQLQIEQFRIPRWAYMNQNFPLAAVRPMLEEMMTQRLAEEWAQENMLTLRQELEKENGDVEKYKRTLSIYVPEYYLTYGPPDALKGNYYDKFSINDAKEFDVLHQAFLKYLPMINLFEGRGVQQPGSAVDRTLKPGDFYKMFFDPAAETFSAGASLFRAMPWPPVVKPSNSRNLRAYQSRAIKVDDVGAKERDEFMNYVDKHDPNQEVPKLDLFKTAAKPILFWRTGEILAQRPTDYDKILTDLKTYNETREKLKKELATNPKDDANLDALRKAEKASGDLQKILDRVVLGWKMEQARALAIPRAEKIALDLAGKQFDLALMKNEAAKLRAEFQKDNKMPADKSDEFVIQIANLSQMHQEEVAMRGKDYFKPPLPKDQIPYPRADMMDELLNLYDLKAPIKVAKTEKDDNTLDKINDALFDRVRKDSPKHPEGKYVQILTNKPRTIFYVAAVTELPKAKDNEFVMSMRGAEFQGDPRIRDLFADRAQQQFARQYRADMIHWIGTVHNLAVPKTVDEKKKFDDRGGGVE